MILDRQLKDYYNEDYILLSDVMTPEAVTENEVAYLIRLLSLTPGQHVLDLGCGYGRIAHGLAQHGIKVTGVDLVPQMLEFARRRALEDGLEIDYIEGDIASLKRQGGFDAVLMWFFVFGYGADRSHAKILRTAYAALRKGGTCCWINTIPIASPAKNTPA